MTIRKTLIALALLALACGKRGDPKPPVPAIPQATTDLAVTQRADRVVLVWSYPALTTAGRSLTEVRRITVFRSIEELPVSAAAGPGEVEPASVPLPSLQFAKVPGLTRTEFEKLSSKVDTIEKESLASATAGARLIFADTPPFRTSDGRPVRVTYAVETEGESARSELSNLASIVPLSVATPPVDVKATAKPEGVTLTWTEPKSAVDRAGAPVITGYHIYRTAPGTPFDELSSPINNAPVTVPTYTDVPPSYGEHEYYVTAVADAGPPLLQSNASPATRVTFRDLVPPPAPAALTALIETKIVRLLWEPVSAPDLAGYRVYRAEGMLKETLVEIGTTPLFANPIAETSFADDKMNLGISYRYGVSAVDKSGNESQKVWTDWVLAPKTP